MLSKRNGIRYTIAALVIVIIALSAVLAGGGGETADVDNEWRASIEALNWHNKYEAARSELATLKAYTAAVAQQIEARSKANTDLVERHNILSGKYTALTIERSWLEENNKLLQNSFQEIRRVLEDEMLRATKKEESWQSIDEELNFVTAELFRQNDKVERLVAGSVDNITDNFTAAELDTFRLVFDLWYQVEYLNE
ncbi:hypothetical protein LCGC14_0744840 [marine sediment metagenome]|uniref:Uncharacterized protein n=1 Tax=marine sediment metagenome TaxID=412755 RepID=A0A0F9SQR8_9ZZZZ